jgi:Tfp pilus assembly PilM family ATPase
MTRTISTRNRLHTRLFGRSVGWIGIEIGCHCIHFAQVRKRENRWQLSAIWSLEHPTSELRESNNSKKRVDEIFGWLSREEMFSNGLTRTLETENLSSLFQGSHCATTLTDGMIAYRELELPSSIPSEANAMARSEIAIETDLDIEELVTDCWELPPCDPRAGTFSYGAVSIKRTEAANIASSMLRAGFQCQTMDALPCAMARSTAMVVADPDTATLAVDLGYQQATLTLVKAGRPVLSRELRGLGVVALLDQIADAFELSRSDAQTLLVQPSGEVTNDKSNKFAFSNPIPQYLSSFFQVLAAEIDKTIQFTTRAYRFAVPSQLLIMGAGSRIANLDRSLEDRTGLSARLWSIDQSDSLFAHKHCSVYAVAAGLSTLAWEQL